MKGAKGEHEGEGETKGIKQRRVVRGGGEETVWGEGNVRKGKGSKKVDNEVLL